MGGICRAAQERPVTQTGGWGEEEEGAVGIIALGSPASQQTRSQARQEGSGGKSRLETVAGGKESRVEGQGHVMVLPEPRERGDNRGLEAGLGGPGGMCRRAWNLFCNQERVAEALSSGARCDETRILERGSRISRIARRGKWAVEKGQDLRVKS